MKKKWKPFLAGALTASLLSVYLSWGSASVHTVKEIFDDVTGFAKSSKGISVYTKAYNPQESEENLGVNINELGYQPLQITVKNNSSHTLVLRESHVSLKNASSQAIVWKVTKSGIPRSMLYRVASIFFWPISIPSTFDTIKSIKVHSKLSRELAAKTLKEEEIILPYSSVNRVVYIQSADFATNYTVTLEDITASEELVFDSPIQ